MLRELKPAQYSVALALNVVTKREGPAPRSTTIRLDWLADIVGSWAGMQRSAGAMRRDVLVGHLEALLEEGWLQTLELEGARSATRVHWAWPSEQDDDRYGISASLRGFGPFVRVPKAIAWDMSLTGAQKKVYSSLHWRLFVDGADDWRDVIKVTHGQLGDDTGLHRNTVGTALAQLEMLGLLTLLPASWREPSLIQLVPLTARYLRLDAPTAMRTRRRLWMPMSCLGGSAGDWSAESEARVELWREHGQDAAAHADYWNVPLGAVGPNFDAVKRII